MASLPSWSNISKGRQGKTVKARNMSWVPKSFESPPELLLLTNSMVTTRREHHLQRRMHIAGADWAHGTQSCTSPEGTCTSFSMIHPRIKHSNSGTVPEEEKLPKFPPLVPDA